MVKGDLDDPASLAAALDTVDVAIEGTFPALGDAPAISFAANRDVVEEVANIAGLSAEEYGKEWELFDASRDRVLKREDGRTYASRARRIRLSLILREVPF